MADDITRAESPRARRSRMAAGKTMGSIDSFLGGGGAPMPPATSKPEMPDPGGFVTDASGVERYKRTPQGLINNCGLANGDDEKNCQICDGKCPDRAKFLHGTHLGDPAIVQPPPARHPPMRPGELDRALSAPRRGSNALDLPAAYGRIVHTTFAFDPDKVFDTLNERLRFKKPMREMGYVDLAEELDDAARLHRDASRLHAHAKVTLAEFEADCEAMRGDMRTQAVTQLKAEKEEKGGKQITDGDVTARMATIFPDEYRRQERLKAQAKATIGHLETLVKVWELRRRELDTMLRECRKGA